MDLTQVSKKWKQEYTDIKRRPKLYLFKLSAFLLFALSYYLLVSPFLDSIENGVKKYGLAGMYLVIGTICLKRIIPETILSFCNGEIINKIDNENDIKKINLFYLIALPCSYLLVLFGKQIKESIYILYYGNRTNITK